MIVPTLKSVRCMLRAIEETDIQNIFKGLSNPEVTRYYDIHFDTLSATEEQMMWYADLLRHKTGMWWAICSADGAVFYGAVGFSNRSATHQKAELGFWLLPEFWGMGLMQETVPVLCDFGFKMLDLNRIEGWVEADNKSCQKALGKLGFELEGTLRDCEFKEGVFISVHIYAKLRERKYEMNAV